MRGRVDSCTHSTAACPAGALGAQVRQLVVAAPRMARLTAREREVAAALAVGWVNKQIADDLSIALRTVETHLRSIFSKLGVDRRAAVAFLYACTLGEPGASAAASGQRSNVAGPGLAAGRQANSEAQAAPDDRL